MTTVTGESEWRDPETGYVRRNLSPTNVLQPMQLVEIEFPAKARVVFESHGRDVAIYHQFFMLEGTIEVTYENHVIASRRETAWL